MTLNEHKEMLGIKVTDEAKAALIIESNRRGISVSELTREKIKDMLVELGYNLEPE